MTKVKVLALLFLIGFCAPYCAAIQCKDESGRNVDWWFLHKLPMLKESPLTVNGYGYFYADAATPHKLSNKNLNTDVTTALGRTLSQYAGKSAPAWVAWNDQPPGTNLTNNKAHAKGVMAFDDRSGFFLRHSVPRFPLEAKTGPYKGYPEYARIYGQTFLCVSYSTSTLNNLATQMIINDVNVYDSSITSELAVRYPALAQLVRGFVSPGTVSSVRTFTSLGGVSFVDFAKSKTCKCELYTAIVAPQFDSDMAVLSWGRPLMGSGCRPVTRYNVMDINGMKVQLPSGMVAYNETKEHSKLTVTDKRNIVCAGDINRMLSQGTRGGGTTCFINSALWNAVTKQIGGWMSCS